MVGNKPTPGSLKLHCYPMFSKEGQAKSVPTKNCTCRVCEELNIKGETERPSGNGEEKTSTSFVIFDGTFIYDKQRLVLY
jgi:hypothetical protein